MLPFAAVPILLPGWVGCGYQPSAVGSVILGGSYGSVDACLIWPLSTFGLGRVALMRPVSVELASHLAGYVGRRNKEGGAVRLEVHRPGHFKNEVRAHDSLGAISAPYVARVLG